MSKLSWALIAIWLGLWLPHAAVRYAFNWDSSLYARGARQFDIRRHQPHPPGYPLWVLAERALEPASGSVYRAQVILALCFTAGALLFFRSFAGAPATALLAFSPVVLLWSGVSATYAVDLFASCLAGWLALRMWRGEGRWAAAGCAGLALATGFRPSAALFLLPVMAIALGRLWRVDRVRALTAAAAGALVYLAWYVPTALSCGGPAAYAALNREQLLSTASRTSLLLGAPALVHAKMVVETLLYLSITGAGLAVAWFAAGRTAGERRSLVWWWVAPVLAFAFLLHCANSGYVMLALPGLALAAGAARLTWRAALAGIACSLAVAWFPWARLPGGAASTPVYLAMRSTPALPFAIEETQREIRARLDSLSGPKVVVCALNRPEAPNPASVRFDYPDVRWLDPSDSQPAEALLCPAAGPPPELRARYPHARRVAGNGLYSLWVTGAGGNG